MQQLNKLKTYLVTAMIVLITSILLVAGTIWYNTHVTDKLFLSGWLIVWIILEILSGIAILYFTLKVSGTKALNSYIETAREEERSKWMKLQTEDRKDSEKEKATGNIDVKEYIKEIIPESRNTKTVESFAKKLMENMSDKFQLVKGICYQENKGKFKSIAHYAPTGELSEVTFKPGDTLGGQAATNQELMLVRDIPESYFAIESGMGKSLPKHLLFIPVVYRKKTIALLELAFFRAPDELSLKVFNDLTESLGDSFFKFRK